MKTFPHWRAVGRAMLDARRRQGVTTKLPTRKHGIASRLYLGPEGAMVQIKTLPGASWFETYTGRVGSANVNPENATQALRVLAALDLIPADIAYAADERYGRCEACGELARWWQAEAEAEPRWVHVLGRDWRVADLPMHQAEVAE